MNKTRNLETTLVVVDPAATLPEPEHLIMNRPTACYSNVSNNNNYNKIPGGAPAANQGGTTSAFTVIPQNGKHVPEDTILVVESTKQQQQQQQQPLKESKKRRRNSEEDRHISFFSHPQDEKPVSRVHGFTPEVQEESESAHPWWTAQELAHTRRDCKRILTKHLGASREEYETYFEILSNSFKPCMLPEHVEYSLHQVISNYPLQARGLERHIIHNTNNQKKSYAPPHVPTVLEFQSKLAEVPAATVDDSQKSLLLAKIATFSSRTSRQLAYKLAEYDAAAAAIL